MLAEGGGVHGYNYSYVCIPAYLFVTPILSKYYYFSKENIICSMGRYVKWTMLVGQVCTLYMYMSCCQFVAE